MKFCFPSLLLLFVFVCPNTARAQISVWQESKSKMQSLKQKKDKGQSRFREWKDYIEKEATTTNYTSALSIGARLNTNGWSGGLYFLKQKGAGQQALWELHFSEIKHEKETKQENTETVFKNLGKGRSYIFGKVNNLYTLQLGYGRQQLLLPALLDGNLSVSIRYAAGSAIAFLKPYCLALIYLNTGTSATAYTRSENTTLTMRKGF